MGELGAAAQGGLDPDIRPARADDRPALLALWEHSVRATHYFLTEADILALRPLVAEALASDALAWWVLAPGASPVPGFLGLTRGTIEALFIHPACRGQGLGRRLMAHAQALAGEAPLAVDVNEQNDAAAGFYAALGFAVVGRSPTDSGGRPFPILHMRREAPTPHQAT